MRTSSTIATGRLRTRSLERARAMSPLARLLSWRLWQRAVRRTGSRDLVTLTVALAVLGMAAVVVRRSGLRYQHTDSLPKGLYRVIPGAPLARGTVAMWCLPAPWGAWVRARHYLGHGRCPGEVEPIGKVVLALGGDTVDFGREGIRVHGRLLPHTAPILRDASGRPLTPVPYGRYVLAPDYVWLWSPYTARSFDSRYFGPLPTTALVAIVRPVWTAHPAAPHGM